MSRSIAKSDEKRGIILPEMSEEWVNQISERYIELYEKITGEKFVKVNTSDINNRIEKNILNFLSNYKK